MFSSNILYDYLSQYCRGIEKITDIAIAGIISSVTLLGSNIIFLLLIKAGLEGYMFAYNAWKFAPFLMISVVFGGMCGLLGGMFAAVKQSRINAMSSFSGACINVMLNIPLTFFFNALGASFATLMSYFTVWLIRLYKSYKLFEFTVEIKKDALNYFVLLLQAVVQIAGLSLLRETFIEIILFVFPQKVTILSVCKSFFPISTNQYWYFTAYVGLFFLMPTLNAIVTSRSEQEFQKDIFNVVLLFSLYAFFIKDDIFS